MANASFLSDLSRIRARARKHAAAGPVAARGTEHRRVVVRLLNDILATELIWLMRYRRRYLLCGGRPEISARRGSGEPTPADRLMRRIIELGGEPDLDPDHLLSRSCADYVARGSVSDMIREDLRAERIAIESYAEVIAYLGDADPSTREMLEANLARERARAARLFQILHELEMQSLEEAG